MERQINPKDRISRAKEFFSREWLFFLALIFFMATSLITGHYPSYSRDEYEVLWILAIFFVVIRGMEKSGLLHAVASRFEKRSANATLLLIATFLISCFVTNDIALLVMVPITLQLAIDRKELLVILEAVTSNAAALLPSSTPQNLFIYWHYQLRLGEFMLTIAPFVVGVFLFALFLARIYPITVTPKNLEVSIHKRSLAYLFFFALVLLAIFKVVPLYLAGIVLLYVLFFDPDALKIDYLLLVVFYLFFGIADNLSTILAHQLHHPHAVFLLAVGLSQLMSNVPATVLLADFTSDWQSLLWGVSVGGYGILWGSLANIIAYRLYVAKYTESFTFLKRFLQVNFLALLFGTLLYYAFRFI